MSDDLPLMCLVMFYAIARVFSLGVVRFAIVCTLILRFWRSTENPKASLHIDCTSRAMTCSLLVTLGLCNAVVYRQAELRIFLFVPGVR